MSGSRLKFTVFLKYETGKEEIKLPSGSFGFFSPKVLQKITVQVLD